MRWLESIIDMMNMNLGKLWEMVRDMDGNTRPPDLPLEKFVSGQEATVKTGHGTTACFQIGKGGRQGFILSACLFNFCAEY